MIEASDKSRLTMAEFAKESRIRADSYHRYHIDTIETPDRQSLPNRFLVSVGKFGLAKLLISEVFEYWGKWDVVFARPCTYGVFSGPVGGFSPRPEKCVGCLRCTIEHPGFVTITPNPALESLGDSYMNSKIISTIDEEARKGTVPVRGQGYRGRFGGPGWDEMFTDMSEIVRPSRDGIHGRELISTIVDIGSKPMRLQFDSEGGLVSAGPKMMSIQVPFALDSYETANSFKNGTRMVQLDRWGASEYASMVSSNPDLMISVRMSFEEGWQDQLSEMIDAGVSVIHFVANNHGVADGGRFIMDIIIEAHEMLIKAGVRDKVTLLHSGGVVAADHLPKAIICGLDAVGLDLPLLVAIQARLSGDTSSREDYKAKLPRRFNDKWACQRIVNLTGSWRDQMLEILGAMGIREVRRLRGEMGRAMWCSHLEEEAFSEIEGFIGGGI